MIECIDGNAEYNGWVLFGSSWLSIDFQVPAELMAKMRDVMTSANTAKQVSHLRRALVLAGAPED
jgi:hypothetical protein